jgi:hypothetical protein
VRHELDAQYRADYAKKPPNSRRKTKADEENAESLKRPSMSSGVNDDERLRCGFDHRRRHDQRTGSRRNWTIPSLAYTQHVLHSPHRG